MKQEAPTGVGAGFEAETLEPDAGTGERDVAATEYDSVEALDGGRLDHHWSADERHFGSGPRLLQRHDKHEGRPRGHAESLPERRRRAGGLDFEIGRLHGREHQVAQQAMRVLGPLGPGRDDIAQRDLESRPPIRAQERLQRQIDQIEAHARSRAAAAWYRERHVDRADRRSDPLLQPMIDVINHARAQSTCSAAPRLAQVRHGNDEDLETRISDLSVCTFARPISRPDFSRVPHVERRQKG